MRAPLGHPDTFRSASRYSTSLIFHDMAISLSLGSVNRSAAGVGMSCLDSCRSEAEASASFELEDKIKKASGAGDGNPNDLALINLAALGQGSLQQQLLEQRLRALDGRALHVQTEAAQTA